MTSFKKEDFSNGVEVRWCPGCGDYAILNAIQRVLPELNLAPEQHVFISGIGCAGRLPYYMNAYGFHTIHGRALTVATGLRAMRDDLAIWVITGDGDALSIGGNHFIHALRRNVNLNVLLFNNQVYGLTKGQFSPTSPQGQVTKTSPKGVEQAPLNPMVMALASGATFVARAIDKDPVQLAAILKAAHEHQGLSFVEIYQDCNIFNNGAFDEFALKNHRRQNTLTLTAGKAMMFGENDEYVFVRDEQGQIAKHPTQETQQPLIHQPEHWMQAMQLAKLTFPEHPVPLGIYYQVTQPCFHGSYSVTKNIQDLQQLFESHATWKQS